MPIFRYYALSLLFFPLFMAAAWAQQTKLSDSAALFLSAEKALAKQEWDVFEQALTKLQDYPLLPYLEYQQLKQRIHTEKDSLKTHQELQQFENKYPDFPFHTSLQTLLLKQSAQHKAWDQFVAIYQPSKNVSLQCQYHMAKFNLTRDKSTLTDPLKLWQVGYSQPKQCNELFHTMIKEKIITQPHVWQRIELALQNKNFHLAHYLAKYLPSNQHPWVHRWEKYLKNPHLIHDDHDIAQMDMNSDLKTKMITQTVQVLTQQDPLSAKKWWETHHPKIPLSDANKSKIINDIAFNLAYKKLPEAHAWIEKMPQNDIEETVYEWQIRFALTQKNWQEIIALYKKLPLSLKQQSQWQYWHARALENSDSAIEAKEIYNHLAKSRNYYGFLAGIKVKQPMHLAHSPLNVSETLQKEISQIAAIQRFEQLHQLGRHNLARIEWFRAMDNLNEQQKLAAAKIAHDMKLHDYAILTIAKTSMKEDLELRFPFAFQTSITQNATQHQLDPAWIFALTRQESAFHSQALSSAGARGLMQLLPTTAQSLAKKHSICYHNEKCLYKTETNIQLGTWFLKELTEKLDGNLILATAAYNAGLSRVQSWLPEQTLEADIWIETVPYKETREYIKSVVAFTSIYRQRLGLPTSLASTLKPVKNANKKL